jgi:O-antigen ligase
MLPPWRDARRGLEGLGAVSLLTGVGVVAHLGLARYAAPRGHAGSGQGFAILIGLVVGSAVGWLLVRPRLARTRPPSWFGRGRWRAAASAAVVAAALIVALVGDGTSANAPARRGVEPSGGLTHGRTHEWRAAVETWLDRPLAGSGSDAYEKASAEHQGNSPTLYAHDLPLESAAEVGVFGLALVLALYVMTARALVRTDSTVARWLLGPAVAAFLLANLVDWPWHLPGMSAMWAVAVGGLVAHPTDKAVSLNSSYRPDFFTPSDAEDSGLDTARSP